MCARTGRPCWPTICPTLPPLASKQARERARSRAARTSSCLLGGVGAVAWLSADATTPSRTHVRPRGYRMLRKIPRLNERVIDAIVMARFGNLRGHPGCPVEELATVRRGGVAHGPTTSKRAWPRLRELTLLERYGADVQSRGHGGLSASWGGTHPGDRGAGFSGDHPPLLQHPDPAQRHDRHGAGR